MDWVFFKPLKAISQAIIIKKAASINGAPGNKKGAESCVK